VLGRIAVKVIDVTEFYSERGGGVRSHLTTKGHVLCQLGHEHGCVAPGPRDERFSVFLGPGEAWIERLRGPSLPYDPTYHLLARPDKIRALVARERPDVLEAHSPYLALAAVLSVPRRSVGVRTFFWHADFIDTYLRVMIERRAPSRAADVALAPLWAAVRAAAGGFDATFAAGARQVEKLREHGVPRVEHAPFGVEKRVFRPAARDEAVRRELLAGAGATAGARLLVGVGRFAVEKRWDVVLDALAKLARPDVVLALFGDGPERAALEARAETAGVARAVRFLGFEKDRGRLAAALASADALVHGCPYETFGLGVAEAMACGLPVVVPDEGGASESVVPQTSEVYRSLDVGACAAAIARLLARAPGELREATLAVSKGVLDVEQHYAVLLARYAALRDARPESAREARA
jgi:alpha-1,6-mannosyltransferase